MRYNSSNIKKRETINFIFNDLKNKTKLKIQTTNIINTQQICN